MDIEKLEKLSCLKINPHQKESIVKSLDGVMEMLHEVESLSVVSLEPVALNSTQFRTHGSESHDKSSLPMEDGLFLAPKVIKKD